MHTSTLDLDSAAVGQTETTVGVADEVLGDDLLGAYRHGSAVLGKLGPRSDLDLLVVARRRTTDGEKRRIAGAIAGISRRPRPIELTIVAQDDVRPWTFPPHLDLMWGEWHRDAAQAWDTGRFPDLAVLLAIAWEGDDPLVGPSIRDVVDRPPWEDVVRAMEQAVVELEPGLYSHDTANGLLTLARIRHTLATQTFATKDFAAAWMLDRLPAEVQMPLERAVAVYRGQDEGGNWDLDAVRETARAIRSA